MALGQNYYISIGDGKTSMYFWAQNDEEALNLAKNHKFAITPKTTFTNCSLNKPVNIDKINENRNTN